MLESISIANFSGLNTQADSSNTGATAFRECRNFILRPIGAIGVPASWPRFTCASTVLNLGYINLVDYKFAAGIRLLIQADDDNWWNVTPNESDGKPANIIVAAPASTLSADLVLTAGQIMAFYFTSGYIRVGGDDYAKSWFTTSIGSVPNATTTYSADRAFAKGYGPVFTDDNGNKWKWYVDNNIGLYAEPIA